MRFFLTRLAFAGLLLFPSLVHGLTPPEKDTQTVWYIVTLDGQRAGWVRIAQINQQAHLLTEVEQKLSFRRGPSTATVELASRFTESRESRPISAWAKQKLGGQEHQTFYEFMPDEILIRPAASAPIERRHPTPSLPWSTPVQSQQRLLEALDNDETAFSIRAIDPSLGPEAVETEWRRQGKEVEISAAGRTWVASRWEQRQSWAPDLITIVYIGSEGQLIRTETELFGMTVVQTLSERDPSTSPIEAPEMLIQSFVEPDRKIDRPHRLRKASFGLDMEQIPPALPQTGVQAVEQTSSSSTKVTIDLDRPRPERIDTKSYLASTLFFDHQSTAVRDLLAQLEVPAKASTLEIAQALRQLVHRSVTSKDLSSVFDTASVVARQKSGDCTEHSVLLTALLRAADIPARSVAGLIYADSFLGQEDIFVYHMWSQAWIDGYWVDLDATLADRPFDATHIALQLVNLEDEQAAIREMASLIPLMGNLKIRVLETVYR